MKNILVVALMCALTACTSEKQKSSEKEFAAKVEPAKTAERTEASQSDTKTDAKIDAKVGDSAVSTDMSEPDIDPKVAVLFRIAETVNVALDGARLLDAVEAEIAKQPLQTRSPYWLVSRGRLQVTEERRRAGTRDSNWKHNPGGFDFVVTLAISFSERSKASFVDTLAINVSEKWILQRNGSRAASVNAKDSREWSHSYTMYSAGQGKLDGFFAIEDLTQARLPILNDIEMSVLVQRAPRKSAVAYLIGKLKDKDPKIKSGGAFLLGLLVPDSQVAIASLTETLTDHDPDVRFRAAAALGAMGETAKAAAPALVAGLKDRDITARVMMASALVSIGKGNAGLPVLLDVLRQGSSDDRRTAILALADMGATVQTAVPTLASLLNTEDEDEFVRLDSAFSLTKIDPKMDQSVIPQLLKIAKSDLKSPVVRTRAIEILEKMGLRAGTAAPDLIYIAESATNFGRADDEVRAAATRALRSISPH